MIDASTKECQIDRYVNIDNLARPTLVFYHHRDIPFSTILDYFISPHNLYHKQRCTLIPSPLPSFSPPSSQAPSQLLSPGTNHRQVTHIQGQLLLKYHPFMHEYSLAAFLAMAGLPKVVKSTTSVQAIVIVMNLSAVFLFSGAFLFSALSLVTIPLFLCCTAHYPDRILAQTTAAQLEKPTRETLSPALSRAQQGPMPRLPAALREMRTRV